MKNLTADSVLPLIRSACMLNFWLYDHIAWLTAGAKVLDFSPKKVSVIQHISQEKKREQENMPIQHGNKHIKICQVFAVAI